MTTRLYITLLVAFMVNAVLFGTGPIVVLAIPSLAENAMQLLPIVIAVSLLATLPIAWLIAPRLRARYWRKRAPAAHLDGIRGDF